MKQLFEKSSQGTLFSSEIIIPETYQLQSKTSIISASDNNRRVLSGLKKGQKNYFEGTWGTAMAFYSWLKKQVQQRYPATDYASSRIQREKLNEWTKHLFLPVKNHEPDLAKAPGNPWLKEFYPDKDHFYLRFTDYLGMNGARQWYERGIRFPGLKHKVHPYYGTYFPTRTEHLELFDEWLKQNNSFGSAVDMGTGCGALTFYLLKHGIKNITATDINPNALFSLQQDLQRLQAGSSVRLFKADFFKEIAPVNAGLLVFNPPWLPQESRTSIDEAMYYNPGFFEDFFAEAREHLSPETTLVLLFSDFARAAGLTREHPIEKELEQNHRFQLIEKISRPLQQKPSPGKNWLSAIRSRENVELWVLKSLKKPRE